MFVHLAQGKAPLVLSLAAWYRVAPSISMSPKGRAGHDGPLSLGNLFAVTAAAGPSLTWPSGRAEPGTVQH